MALFRANTETDFNRVVSNLKKLGYVWATDFPREPTFEECKRFYHGNSKLLIHAFFNDITDKHEMSATTISVLKTYPQYKGINLRKEIRR
jgi:hypothetical protein